MVNRIMPINGRSKIQDITSLPTYYNTITGVLGTLNDIMKQGGVSLSHGCLILPGSLIYLKVLSIGLQCTSEAALLSCPIYAKDQGQIPPQVPRGFHQQ